MLFRLFRLPLLLGLAFLAGIVYERDQQAQDCTTNAELLSGGQC